MARRRTGDPSGYQVELVDRSRGGNTAAKKSGGKYIAVAGNMGAGKSSMVEFLCNRYDIDPFFEPNDDNPYLADFYGDMPRWALASQIYFLTAKLRMHRELSANPRNVIQDRTIWEDAEIFAENLYRQRLMPKREYLTYRQLYEAVRGSLRPPDVMIYLRCSVKAVMRRIEARGRKMEKAVPVTYIRRLNKLYEAWIDRYSLSPVIIIPTDKLDYLTDMVDCHEILSSIEGHLS